MTAVLVVVLFLMGLGLALLWLQTQWAQVAEDQRQSYLKYRLRVLEIRERSLHDAKEE